LTAAEQILKKYWGYDGFRPLQQEIINSILGNKDTLALLPTGGGKSVCYQVPAMLQEGVCLVISPLIALMLDQVGRLQQLDIPAACIHSGMHYNEVKRILGNTIHGAYKLLYLSPERLQTQQFRDYLGEMDLGMVAVDEAHCVSQWGHDFRPDYLKIAEIRGMFKTVPFLALTATATPEVQQDIVTQLQLRSPAVIKQSFARQNIFYDVRYSENKNADTLKNTNNGCSIVYCRSRRQTEAICKYLGDFGVKAVAYHAGMTKELREKAQEQWMNNVRPVMAATTAFGMGIDKADVRTIVHYDAPENLEAYYQEAGRAGRDGKPSAALALYNSTDINRLRDSVALHYPAGPYLRQVYQAVAEYLQIPISAQPDKYYPFDLYDFCKKFSLQANAALHALKLLEQEGLWTLTEAVYSPATIQFIADRHVLDNLAAMHPDLGYVTLGLLRMYNTIFHFPTPVRETGIAKQLKMKMDELLPLLDRLDKMEILEYNRPGVGPQLFFHHYRVDSRHLIIDLERISTLRKRHEARTDAMIAFLENRSTCRERVVLTYFGERPVSDCGHCDVCRDRRAVSIDERQLKDELLKKIRERPNITVNELVMSYSKPVKENAMEIIRTMVDENLILYANGVVTVC
jgi:ATP-dependent DNA helicase RecQ